MKKILLSLFVLISIGAKAQLYPCVMNGNGFFTISSVPVFGNPPTTLFTQTSSVTYSNSTTETVSYGSGVGTDTIPANYMTAGKLIVGNIAGVLTMPAITAGTIIVKVYFGSTVIATGTTSITGLAGATNTSYSSVVRITCQSGGASGSLAIDGSFNYSTGNNLAKNSLDLNNGGAVVTGLDFTSKKRLYVTYTWDAATTTRSIKTNTYYLQALN